MATTSVPTEAAEARELMKYCKIRHLKYTHIKNETGRAIAMGKARNSRAFWGAVDGVSPGFPDFFIITKNFRGIYRPCFIELKRLKGSKVSPEQIEWVNALNEAGIPAKICYGAIDAVNFIQAVERHDWRAEIAKPKPKPTRQAKDEPVF